MRFTINHLRITPSFPHSPFTHTFEEGVHALVLPSHQLAETFMRQAIGLQAPDEGQLLWNQQSALGQARLRAQLPALFPNETAIRDFALPTASRPRLFSRPRPARVVDFLRSYCLRLAFSVPQVQALKNNTTITRLLSHNLSELSELECRALMLQLAVHSPQSQGLILFEPWSAFLKAASPQELESEYSDEAAEEEASPSAPAPDASLAPSASSGLSTEQQMLRLLQEQLQKNLPIILLSVSREQAERYTDSVVELQASTEPLSSPHDTAHPAHSAHAAHPTEESAS